MEQVFVNLFKNAIEVSLLESCLHYKNELGEENRRDFETAVRVMLSRTASPVWRESVPPALARMIGGSVRQSD